MQFKRLIVVQSEKKKNKFLSLILIIIYTCIYLFWRLMLNYFPTFHEKKKSIIAF